MKLIKHATILFKAYYHFEYMHYSTYIILEFINVYVLPYETEIVSFHIILPT